LAGSAVRITQLTQNVALSQKRCSRKQEGAHVRRHPIDQEIPEPPPLRHSDEQLHHSGGRKATGARPSPVQGGRCEERGRPHGILLQIILEEESAGAPMFSSDMLSQIIRF
jgi:hypothetical protein